MTILRRIVSDTRDDNIGIAFVRIEVRIGGLDKLSTLNLSKLYILSAFFVCVHTVMLGTPLHKITTNLHQHR